MPLTPEQVYARIVEQVGADGRLPMPPVATWDIFPWESVRTEAGETWLPKVVQPPLESEPPRWGEGGKPCQCEGGDDPPMAVWRNERWVVTSTEQPTGMPLMLFLHSREHLDLDDLDDAMAAEYGRLQVWLHRIMARLPHIGRVHVCKWGDGGSHLHLWFIARYERLPNILGSMAVEWDEMLPPPSEDVWRADVRHVAEARPPRRRVPGLTPGWSSGWSRPLGRSSLSRPLSRPDAPVSCLAPRGTLDG